MKILVLGIGNTLFADEGIGVHFVNMMQSNFRFTSAAHTLEFVDGGTLANLLIPIIAKYDYLILADCIDATDSKAGDVYFFDFAKLPKKLNWSGSAHEVEMLQTLEMMDLVGDRPPTKVIGIIPKRIEPMSFDLSISIKNGVKVMEKVLLKELEKLGFSFERVANFSIDDISARWKKGQF